MVRFAIIFVLFLAPTISLKITDFRVANATEPSVFSQALPGYVYRFPEDFYSHDDFRIEWWYYTGNLEEIETARPFGYQLTFFRVALDKTDRNPSPSQWKVGHIYFAHMTVTDIDGG